MVQQQNIQGEYTFLPQEHILFGAGSSARLADEVKRLGGTRVVIITGRSLATKTEVIQTITRVLGPLYVATFHEIGQHAPKSGIDKALELVRSQKVDLLVSVGGGSPIDAAKAVSYFLHQQGGAFLPHIAIPTTLSAAEFASHAGYTEEKTKTGVADPQLTPKSVILDAALTLTTPEQLWLSTGIRALDHAVELLYAPGNHPINDPLSLSAIQRLFTYLPHSKEHPDALDARTELQIAAWMSMFGAINASFGLSHKLGRRIGATYDVPHGITSCITLPTVMHSYATERAQALARIAQALELPARSSDPVQAAHQAADAVANLIVSLGLPRHLHEVGIGASDLHAIAVGTVGDNERTARIEELLKQML